MKVQSIESKINYNKTKINRFSKSVNFTGLPNTVEISTIKDFQGRKPFSIIDKIEIGIKKLLGLYSVKCEGTYQVKKFLEPYYLTADDIIIPREVTVKGNYRALNSIELHGKVAKNCKITSDKSFYINVDSIMDGDAYGKYFYIGDFAKISGTVNASEKAKIFGDILEKGEVNAPIVSINHHASIDGTINATECMELNRMAVENGKTIKMVSPKCNGKINTPVVIESCI